MMLILSDFKYELLTELFGNDILVFKIYLSALFLIGYLLTVEEDVILYLIEQSLVSDFVVVTQ